MMKLNFFSRYNYTNRNPKYMQKKQYLDSSLTAENIGGGGGKRF